MRSNKLQAPGAQTDKASPFERHETLYQALFGFDRKTVGPTLINAYIGDIGFGNDSPER